MKGRRNQTPHTLIWFGSLVLVSVVSTALVAFIWTNLSSAKQDVVVREKFDCVPSDFSTASKESYGLLNDINDQSWRRMKERVKNRKNHKHPEEPWTSSVEPNQWYQDNWEPDFSCPHERRVGGMGDGGKWVCNPHRITEVSRSDKRKCLIYSVGSRGDFSFELGLHKVLTGGERKKSCEIHVFDPIDYSSKVPRNIQSFTHFHAWGISNESTANKDFLTMEQTVRKIGHHGSIVDVFKIDCEGCEWSTFRDWFSVGLDIRQILVEVHSAPSVANKFFDTLQDEGYVIFHKEPNIIIGGRLIEYAFLKLNSSFFN